MEDYKENIARARADLETAQIRLVDAYLSKIRQGYLTLNPRQKELITHRLETFVDSIEKGDFTYESGGFSARGSTRKNSVYNPRKAREIRKRAGLNQRQLAEELGLTRSEVNMISLYERGKVKPSNPPRGKTSKVYVGWLKENGYNPFGL